MTLLLFAYLITQTWAWDPVAGATSYRLYYGPSPHHWCPMQYAEVDSNVACDLDSCEFDITEPQGDLILFNVIAVNAAGTSPWDHGVLVCP